MRPAELGVFDGAADDLEPDHSGSERGPSMLCEILRKGNLQPLYAVVDRLERRPVPVERQRHDRAVVAVCMRRKANAFMAERPSGRWRSARLRCHLCDVGAATQSDG